MRLKIINDSHRHQGENQQIAHHSVSRQQQYQNHADNGQIQPSPEMMNLKLTSQKLVQLLSSLLASP
ncbi:hypothetical protein M9782_13790 [Pectobacterium actinidiae]|nr:hypothetical protein [Pectobacterium actinidiae]WEF10289.1 hypothetical protein M9782_13790 [Pectobacterium actinidiae]GKV88530.1 hypothetical protein PEC301619_05120 [Pectobacterium carotovorum subsp. carotovorum]